MNIPLLIVVVYLLVLFGISLYVRRRTTSSEGLLFADRKMTTLLITANVTALAVGAASTIGVAESAFANGIAAAWYNGAWGIGAIAMGLIAAGKYREMECTTIPELFERYYDQKGRALAVVCMIIVLLVITSLQYIAGGAILSSLLPEYFSFEGGMITSAAAFIITTLIGGLWFSGISNILSVILIYAGCTLSAFTVLQTHGGLGAIVTKLPPTVDWLSPIGPLGIMTIVGWIAVMVTQTLTAQGPVQIACSAKDGKTARNGFMIAGVLMIPIGVLCAILGLAARLEFPAMQATLALPKLLMSMDPVLAGITLAALWSADIGTASPILLGAGTLFSQDIYKRFINPNVSDKNYTIINRVVILVLGLSTLWLAFNASGIVKTMLIGLSITAAFTSVFLATLFFPSICRKSTAFATTLVGLLTIFAWLFIPATHMFLHPIYLEWVVCVVTIVIVPLFDHRRIDAMAGYNKMASAVSVK